MFMGTAKKSSAVKSSGSKSIKHRSLHNVQFTLLRCISVEFQFLSQSTPVSKCDIIFVCSLVTGYTHHSTLTHLIRMTRLNNATASIHSFLADQHRVSSLQRSNRQLTSCHRSPVLKSTTLRKTNNINFFVVVVVVDIIVVIVVVLIRSIDRSIVRLFCNSLFFYSIFKEITSNNIVYITSRVQQMNKKNESTHHMKMNKTTEKKWP